MIFTNFSMAGSGLIVFIITLLFNLAGVVPEGDQVVQLANNAILLGSLVMTAIGQFRRKDLKMGIIRKDE